MVKIIWENIFLFPSKLGAFAPWREQYPNPRAFDFRNICARLYTMTNMLVLVFG